MGLRIKLVPQWDEPIPRPDEVAEFRKAVDAVTALGYAHKLLHFTNGTVLLEKLSDWETAVLKGKHA